LDEREVEYCTGVIVCISKLGFYDLLNEHMHNFNVVGFCPDLRCCNCAIVIVRYCAVVANQQTQQWEIIIDK